MTCCAGQIYFVINSSHAAPAKLVKIRYAPVCSVQTYPRVTRIRDNNATGQTETIYNIISYHIVYECRKGRKIKYYTPL